MTLYIPIHLHRTSRLIRGIQGLDVVCVGEQASHWFFRHVLKFVLTSIAESSSGHFDASISSFLASSDWLWWLRLLSGS